MIFQDLHTHSLFDDGSATLEDMVSSAIRRGLRSIGFSGHSPMPGSRWAIPQDRLADYFSQARALQRKYRSLISVFCGLEWDISSDLPQYQTDYMIGSKHLLGSGSDAFEVDHCRETTAAGVKRLFDGDFEAAEDAYYAGYTRLLDAPRARIVGHYDLITKFDEERRFFRLAPSAALDMMEKLVKADKIFEVNTGAICRSGRITPYPSIPLLQALHEMGGRVTLSSDSHSTDALLFGFEAQLRSLKDCGFREIWLLSENGFFPEEI